MESLKKGSFSSIIKILLLALLSLLALISVVQGVRNAAAFSQDFQWDAIKALMERVDPYEMSLNPAYQPNNAYLDEFYGLFEDAGVTQVMEANQFPSLLMLLIPFTWMKPLAARYAWIVANLLFTAGIILLLKKTFLKGTDRFEFAVIALLMLAGTPYRNQLGVGQHTLFSFFFFMLAVYLDEKKLNGNRIGITLAMFISYFKYTLTAPLTLYLLYKKRFREFVISLAMHVILTLVAAKMLGKSFIYMIIEPLKVSSALSAEGGLDLGALLGGGMLYLVIAGLFAITLVIITVKMPENKEFVLYPLLLLWSLILTYHRTYDFFVLASLPVLYLGMKESALFKDKKIFSERLNLSLFIKVSYYALLILVYFGLRVFNENLGSRIAVGAIYYIFTGFVTYIAIYVIKKSER